MEKLLPYIYLLTLLPAGFTCKDINLMMDKSVSKFNIKPSPPSPECPWTSIVTIGASPDLATQIWEYATVYSVGRYTGLDPYVPPMIHRKLSLIFNQLTVESFVRIIRCKFNAANFVFKYSDWKDMDQSLYLAKGTIELPLIFKYMDVLLGQFELTEDFRRAGTIAIERALRRYRTETVVGIHIDKGDFDYLSLVPEAMSYYSKAMDYFREEYGNVTFLVVCGTNPVCSDKFHHLTDVYVYKHDNIERLDVAILSLCDHVVFKNSGLGLWGGLLAGGKIAYNYCGELVVSEHRDQTMIQELVRPNQECPEDIR